MGTVTRNLNSRVLRALGVFGSLEVVTILCSVIRTKLVALWLGTTGVGIISLYNSTLEMLKALSQFNLRQSATREIAAAASDDRPCEVRATVSLGNYIGLITAILTAALSPLLSRLTFGSADYTWGFAALSATMFAASASSARSAVLQGLGELRRLARASLYAAVVSTALAVPLFYFFRDVAIVPVLMIYPFATLLFLLVGSRGLAVKGAVPGIRPAMWRILKLGGWLAAASGVVFAADYALRVYLQADAGTSAVGVFQAGYTIVNTYLGVVFTSITMEYFPRLSSTVSHRAVTRAVVAHEITLVTWIVLPVAIAFIALDGVAVRLLYSSAFDAALPYMDIGAVATALRGASWCMAFVIVARGDGAAYIVTETLSCVVMLAAAIPMWHAWGYAGLGAAYVVQYAVYTAVVAWVCRRRYGLAMPRPVTVLTVAAPLVSAAALALKMTVGWWCPLLMLPFAGAITVRVLRRR